MLAKGKHTLRNIITEVTARHCDLFSVIRKKSLGVIIEIKAAKDIKDLEVQSNAALTQIHAKNYDKGQEDFFDLSEIIAVGLAFYKKKCLVKIEKIKL